MSRSLAVGDGHICAFSPLGSLRALLSANALWRKAKIKVSLEAIKLEWIAGLELPSNSILNKKEILVSTISSDFVAPKLDLKS
jgi:hypothetical protein